MASVMTTCTIYRKTEGTANAAGESEESWVQLSGSLNLPVDIQPISSKLKVAAPGVQPESSHRIFFMSIKAAMVTIAIGDRIVDKASNSYIVNALADWQIYKSVDVRKE